jgi:pimeloyl-ACP methyl ester carboxylesterase
MMKQYMELCVIALVLGAGALSAVAEDVFPGKETEWNGFVMYNNNSRKVVVPKTVADGKPWVWRARFWGHQPQFDIALLNKGYHLVYCNVGGLYGSPEAVKRWDEFYTYLTGEHGFAKQVVLEGMSRGGFIIYNWASKNPEKVAVLYGDAPVMDFKSWPGVGNDGMLKAYGFKNEEEAKAYKGNPIDTLAPLAKANVPIIHVVGDADTTVPVSENTAVAEKRYQAMGGVFEVIHKEGVGHHPHSLKDPAPLVSFVEKHYEGK